MSTPKPPGSSEVIPSFTPPPTEGSKDVDKKAEPGSLDSIEPDQTSGEPVGKRVVSKPPLQATSSKQPDSKKSKKKRKKKEKSGAAASALRETEQKRAEANRLHEQERQKILKLAPELTKPPEGNRRGGSRSKAIDATRIKLSVINYGQARGATREKQHETLVNEVQKVIQQEGESIHTHFINASLNLSEAKFDRARDYVNLLLAQISPDDEMYARTLLLKGKINYFENEENREVTGETAEAFQTAWLLGNSQAAKYYMMSMMSTSAPRSTVKWFDLAEVVKVAARFPEVHTNYKKQVSEIVEQLQQPGISKSQKLTDFLLSADLLNELEPTATHETGFPFALTEYFSILGRKKDELAKQQQFITGILDSLATKFEFGKEISDQYRSVLQYAVALKTQETDHAITSLTAKGSTLASQLLAGILLAKNPKRREEATTWLEKSKEHFPVAYEYLAEMSLSDGQFTSARNFYQQSVDHIEHFLSGKRPLMGLHIGQEAHSYKTAQPDTYKVLKLEEQAAAEQLLEKYQHRLDLLESICSEAPADKNAGKSDTKPASKAESMLAATYSPLAGVPETESVQTAAHSPQAETSSSEEESDGEAWTIVRKKARTYGSESIKNHLNRAADLTDSPSGLDEAERLLESVKPEENSLPYFQKQQSLCWINHERANPENYGKPGFVIPGRSSAKKYLNRAMIMATGNIQKLEGMTTATKTTGLSVRINEEECIKIAEELDAIDPGLRKKYGGFYSTLGHIQKALRGHCQNKKALNDCVQKGLDYYDMANFIRQRQPSQFAKPEQ